MGLRRRIQIDPARRHGMKEGFMVIVNGVERAWRRTQKECMRFVINTVLPEQHNGYVVTTNK